MSAEPGGRPPVRAVVVDDEPAGRDAVRTLLDAEPRVAVVGEAADGASAVQVVQRLQPDLLFLDIQMPDMDGFGVLEALDDHVPPGVILVTAHGEHAQRAFEVHALDYVVKPFGKPRFQAAVDRALLRLEADEALGLRETLRALVANLREGGSDGPAGPGHADVTPEAPAGPTRIGVRHGSRTRLVEVADIEWIEADGDLARLHATGKSHLVSNRMRDLEQSLAPAGFLRIHRSIIVNLSRVEVLHRDRDGGGVVALRGGVRLRVARGRWEALEAALGL